MIDPMQYHPWQEIPSLTNGLVASENQMRWIVNQRRFNGLEKHQGAVIMSGHKLMVNLPIFLSWFVAYADEQAKRALRRGE